MQSIREVFRQTKLPEEVIDILMKSWTCGKSKQYSPHIQRWCEFCSSRNLNPFNATINDGAEFLTQYFLSSECEYSVINTARSALSSIFPSENDLTFGKQPIIQRLLKGMFKERPTFSRYTVTYDVKPVFDFIKSLSCSDETSLEICTKAVATLMCLLSGQRFQTLSALKMDTMYIDEHRSIFYISKLLKSTRPGFHQHPLEFVAYPTDKCLCVVRLIRLYLRKTSTLRKKDDSSFFISYVAPHKPVSPKTIARWVVKTSEKSGINTTTFKAHSTCAASTSSARCKGLSLTEIAKAAGWSNFSTFGKFYNKPINDVNFGSNILNGVYKTL